MSLEKILRIVTRETEVSLNEMKDENRKRQKVEARMIASYMIKEFIPEMSLVAIGELFGGRDHSTIIYYLNKVEDLAFTDGPFFNKIEGIRKMIQSEFPKKVTFTWQWETNTTLLLYISKSYGRMIRAVLS